MSPPVSRHRLLLACILDRWIPIQQIGLDPTQVKYRSTPSRLGSFAVKPLCSLDLQASPSVVQVFLRLGLGFFVLALKLIFLAARSFYLH
jgi:hypothetical protein